ESAPTDHFGEPRPVTPVRQPDGEAPGLSWSNVIVAVLAMFMMASTPEMVRIVAGGSRCSELSRGRVVCARTARRVPRREAAADKARVEAALDERLRHVAPDIEAVGAVNGHRFVQHHLRDPLLDAIRVAPRSARHQIRVARHVVSLPRVDNLHTAAFDDLRGE